MNTEAKKEVPPVKYPASLDLKKLKAGDKVKQLVYLQVSTYGSISVSGYQFSEHVQLGSMEVEFTVVDGFNPVQAAVAAIDKQIENVMDEAYKRTAPMKQKKAELLQITYGGNEILDKEEK